MYRVGFVGAGKVGTSLGLYLFSKGDLMLGGFYSRTYESALYGAKLTKSKAYRSLEYLVRDSDIIIITSPDDEIRNIWTKIRQFNIENKIICHCSGSLSSSIFFDDTTKVFYACSVHPMMAISSREDSYKDLDGVFFSLEGDGEALNVFSKQLEVLGNPYRILSSDDKRKYHLATVLISNCVIGLGEMSVDLLKEYGFTEEEALLSLANLGRINLDNFFSKGAKSALTGPLERNDLSTIRGHLDSIDGEKWDLLRGAYLYLSLILLDLAEEKNPGKDYRKMEMELKKGVLGLPSDDI